MSVTSPPDQTDGSEEYGTFDWVRIINHGRSYNVKGYHERDGTVDKLGCHIIKSMLELNGTPVVLPTDEELRLEDVAVAHEQDTVQIQV